MADNRDFVLAIRRFRITARQAVDAVHKQSLQDVIEDAQTQRADGGRMPVRTGFLRNSVFAQSDASVGTGNAGYAVAIAGASENSPIAAGWTAPYAAAVEFGTGGRNPAGFARGAVNKWQSFVIENARRIADGN